MGILWKHLWARIKPRLSYGDIESIFRYYAEASALNEPISSYVRRITESDPTVSPVDDLVEHGSDRLRAISLETNKERQARECRMFLLEEADTARENHYLTIGADESLRDVCLAAMSGAEADADLERKHYEKLWSYFEALWVEVSLACLYEEQFNRCLPLDSFDEQYRAMTKLYIRFLCNKLFSAVMSEHDRKDLQRVSEWYDAACSDSTVRQLSETRHEYREAIRSEIIDHLYPHQERFAEVAREVQSQLEEGVNADTA